MADDELTSALAECREIEQAATPGPWEAEENDDCWQLFGAVTPNFHPLQLIKAPKRDTPYAEYWPNDADAAFIVAARTAFPRLQRAVDAVLKLHQPADRGRVMRCCRGCEEVDGEFHESFCHEWPCPTVRAITAELTKGEASDGRS
jgi:hypothetical protein